MSASLPPGPRHTTRSRSPLYSLAVSVGIVSVLVVGTSALAIQSARRHSRPSHARTAAVASPSESAVTTYKGNNARTGGYLHETVLSTGSLVQEHFGHILSYPVDGQVYAQPLYVPHVAIGGQTRNVIYVATEHDSVYAFDADAASAVAPLWQTSFLPPGVSTVPAQDVFTVAGAVAIRPEVGITGTPVIDQVTGTLYVVAMTKESGGRYVQQLHALDIRTGADRSVSIDAQVEGSGVDSAGGVVAFNAFRELQRSALLLVHGVVYLAWASFGDASPFHGWVMGYDAQTLRQVYVLNITPDGEGGGIWESGGGLASDPDGNALYFTTGNGSFNLTVSGHDAGDSVVKVSSSLQIDDYFTPFNQSYLAQYDLDLGSSGLVLLAPDPSLPHHLLVTSSKEGKVYLLDTDKMGHYSSDGDQVVQELPAGTISGGAFCTPALWQGPSASYLYFSGLDDHIKSFSLSAGRLSTAPASQSPDKLPYPGGNAVVSSNGSLAGTGIVWVTTPDNEPRLTPTLLGAGRLRAYDATNLEHELANVTLTSYVKFSVPTVANGRVFVGTGSTLDVFGFAA